MSRKAVLYGYEFDCEWERDSRGHYPTRIDWDSGKPIEEDQDMFSITASPKPDGQCPARRCTTPAADPPPEDNANGLCVRHYHEWKDAGAPALIVGAAAPKTEPGTAIVKAPAVTIEAEIEVKRNEARQYLALCQAYEITDQSDADRAGEIMAGLKHERNTLETKRREITDPMNAALKKVNQLFKPVVEYLDSCEKALKGSLSKFLLAQQAAQDEALAKVAQAPAVVGAETLAVAHGVENIQAPATVSTRRIWRVVKIDTSRLPQEYFIPDTDRINREVRALGGDFNIPGVTIEPDLQITNRG